LVSKDVPSGLKGCVRLCGENDECGRCLTCSGTPGYPTQYTDEYRCLCGRLRVRVGGTGVEL
jgi:hypothetical protein